MSNNHTEINILGCNIRIKSSDDNDTRPMQAVQLLKDEINEVRKLSPTLKESDIAVLSALNIARRSLDKEAEFKENIFSLKAGVEGALKYVEEVSPGSMQINS